VVVLAFGITILVVGYEMENDCIVQVEAETIRRFEVGTSIVDEELRPAG
jgi:hypothetical protein